MKYQTSFLLQELQICVIIFNLHYLSWLQMNRIMMQHLWENEIIFFSATILSRFYDGIVVVWEQSIPLQLIIRWGMIMVMMWQHFSTSNIGQINSHLLYFLSFLWKLCSKCRIHVHLSFPDYLQHLSLLPLQSLLYLLNSELFKIQLFFVKNFSIVI